MNYACSLSAIDNRTTSQSENEIIPDVYGVPDCLLPVARYDRRLGANEATGVEQVHLRLTPPDSPRTIQHNAEDYNTKRVAPPPLVRHSSISPPPLVDHIEQLIHRRTLQLHVKLIDVEMARVRQQRDVLVAEYKKREDQAKAELKQQKLQRAAIARALESTEKRLAALTLAPGTFGDATT